MEISPPSVVRQAVSDFANALAETVQFKAFEQANNRMHQDSNAQMAIAAYQGKWRSLEVLIRLNALSAEDQQELERLRQVYLARPTVADYAQAQADLAALCQASEHSITQATGLSFAAICSSGCCG
jgi:cell fate (sporulation/competence/biofilm development) regulator YlbF (YheA/YmcA/DUF963 family)